jgi:hypothetical protein
MRTVPVNHSAGPFCEGCVPARVMRIRFRPPVAIVAPPFAGWRSLVVTHEDLHAGGLLH